MLGSAFDGRLPRRLRVQSESPLTDLIPWEAMSLGGPEPIGLNPKHCLIRGKSNPAGTSSVEFPLNILLVGFSGLPIAMPTQPVQSILKNLNTAFQPLVARDAVRTRIMEDPPLKELLLAITYDKPQIVHIVAMDGFQKNGGGLLGLPPTQQDWMPSFDTAAGQIRDAGVRILMLEIPNGRERAKDWAQYVWVVVGIQNNLWPQPDGSFGLGFYRALLRSGQADFALTEGRRSVAKAVLDSLPTTPPAPAAAGGQSAMSNQEIANWNALSYFSYQFAGTASVFEAGGTPRAK
jgi:hypothetical protein